MSELFQLILHGESNAALGKLTPETLNQQLDGSSLLMYALPVSYTHLDVYKRQMLTAVPAMPEKPNTAAISAIIKKVTDQLIMTFSLRSVVECHLNQFIQGNQIQ